MKKKSQYTNQVTVEELNSKRKAGMVSAGKDILDMIRRRCLLIPSWVKQLDRAELSIYWANILMVEKKTKKVRPPKVYWLSYEPEAPFTIVVSTDLMPMMGSTELNVTPPTDDHPDFVLMMPTPNHLISILMPNNVAWSKPKTEKAKAA